MAFQISNTALISAQPGGSVHHDAGLRLACNSI